jgi:hypothetical protein
VLEHTRLVPSDRTRVGIRRGVAIAAAATATVVFLIRLPSTFDNLDTRASFNAKQDPIGRTIQATDGLGIQNEFAIQALALLPRHATYVVDQPASDAIGAKYGISPTTLLALRGYMRFLLLPRRDVAPDRAQYVLCYGCNTDPYDKRGMKRLWSDPHGYVIGRMP